jgi:hypothetical protein
MSQTPLGLVHQETKPCLLVVMEVHQGPYLPQDIFPHLGPGSGLGLERPQDPKSKYINLIVGMTICQEARNNPPDLVVVGMDIH